MVIQKHYKAEIFVRNRVGIYFTLISVIKVKRKFYLRLMTIKEATVEVKLKFVFYSTSIAIYLLFTQI